MITGHLIIRNGFKYDYPWLEAIKSILPAVDEFILLEAYSDDDTYKACQELAEKNKKIRLIRGVWTPQSPIERKRPYFALARLTNKCIAHVQTDWHIQIQGDEILHEDSIDYIKELPKLLKGTFYNAARVHYTHFVANYSTTFPFIYENRVRIARRDSAWRSLGDACEMGLGASTKVYDTPIQYFHYGKIKPSNLAMLKEKAFQSMFKAIGFPDPKLAEMGGQVDYFYLFKDAYQKGLFKGFNGSHPKVMAERIEQAKKDGWEQFGPTFQKNLCKKNG